MKLKQILSMVAVLAASLTSIAHAGMVQDAHGNVGYDTAAECDAAIQSGTARFYQSFTHKAPLVRKGEKGVQRATIKDLGEQYARGACDIGMGKKLGRDGVSTVLQGKFIPFSPDMPVNVYTDANGNAVRVTMGQCDNWFSGNAPRPVAVLNNTPMEAVEPVATAPEVVATPAVTPAIPKAVGAAALLTPYVFGTIGMHRESMDANGHQPSFYNRGIYHDSSNTVNGQFGFGLQLNPYVGGEIYVEGGPEKKYTSTDGHEQKVKRWGVGSRFTLGTNATDALRIFLTGGIKAVHQDDFHPQWTVGIGSSYKFTDQLALRVDYNHDIKRSKHVYYDNMGFSKSHYFGIGLQFNFK